MSMQLRRNHHRWGAVVKVAVIAMVVAACTGNGTGTDTTQPTGTTGATSPGTTSGEDPVNERLVIGIPSDQVSLDATVVGTGNTGPCLEGIFSALTERGMPFLTDGTLLPGIATEFVSSEDGMTWTLTIRDDAVFHNGEPVTAEDVAFSINLFVSPAYDGTVTGAYVATVESAEVIDADTVQVNMAEPDALFYTSSPRVYVISQAYYEEVGAEGFARHPISAGPYKYVSWQPDNVLILEAHDEFFLGEPEIKEVHCRVLPNDAGRLAALRTGEIDIAAPLAIEQVPEVEADPNLKVLVKASLNRMYITLDTTVPPWDQREVRLAVNHAVDRQLIIDQLLAGQATIIPGGLVPGLEPGANTSLVPYAYDPDLARQYLVDAGYPDGLEPEFGVQDLVCRDGYAPKTEEICTVLAEMLGDVGIPVQIVMMENTAFENASSDKTIGPVMYTGHSGGGNFHGQHHLRSTKVCTDRAGEVTTPLRPSAEWGGWYCNPEVDARVWEATQLWGTNYPRALELIAEAEAIMYEDAAAGFLFAMATAYGVKEGLNWEPPARPDYNFFGASWDN